MTKNKKIQIYTLAYLLFSVSWLLLWTIPEQMAYAIYFALSGQLAFSIAFVWLSLHNILLKRKTEIGYKLQGEGITYREIFDATSDAIYIHDFETLELLDVNVTAYTQHGFPYHEMLDLSVLDFSSGEPGYNEKDAVILLESVKAGGNVSFKWQDKRKNGEFFWTMNRAKVTTIGEKKCIMVIARDITEELRQKEALRSNEIRYQELFEQASDGILVGVDTGVIVASNTRIEEITGYTLDEIVGQNIKMLFANHEMNNKPLRYDLILAGKTLIVERMIKHKLGGEVPIEMSTKMVSDGRLLSFLRDLTDRKQIQFELEKSELKYRELIENSNSVILKLTPDGKITFANEYALHLFGYTEEELLDSYLWESILDQSQSFEGLNMKDWFYRVFVKNVSKYHTFDNWNQTKNKENKFMHWTNNAMYDTNGKLTEIVTVGNDKTELKITYDKLLEKEEILEKKNTSLQLQNAYISEINKELKDAKQQAERNDVMKTSFLQNISHEIRTPLNGIVGFSELLADPDLEHSDRKEFTDLIIESSRSLLTLVNDLLDISRIESGTVKLYKRPSDVGSLVDRVYRFFKSAAEAKNIELKLRMPSQKIGLYMVDEDRLKQVLVNLIGNALKFTTKGHIQITCSKTTDGLFFEVSDTGIGILEENLHKVFERFKQASNNTAQEYGGSGLGLTISKAIVILMEGDITVKSTYGEGASFSFNIKAEQTDK